jgi:hypothetical protein
MLLPFLILHNSVNFSRLKPAQGAGGGFTYVGHTMPWTNVNIYRNGTLISTEVSSSNGSYKVSSPQAIGGDIFTIVLYYKNGERKEKEITIAGDYGLLLKKGTWNLQLNSGQLVNGHGFSRLAYRYGFSSNVSAGVHALLLPYGNKTTAAMMIDIAWRPKTWLNILSEAMEDEAGLDYDLLANITYFKNHTLQVEVKNINKESPLNSLDDNTDNPLSQILGNTNEKSISFKDIYNIKTWRITSGFTHELLQDSVNEEADGQINANWSATLDAGAIFPRVASVVKNKYAQGLFNYQINNAQLLTFGHAWLSGAVGESSLTYRYQDMEKNKLNASISVLISDSGDVTVNGNITWEIKHHWLFSINANSNEVSAVISFEGIFSRKDQYRDYDDFGTGSVQGYVDAPPKKEGGKAIPIEGAVVQVDNQHAITDKNGYYFVPDIEVNARVIAKVDPGSLKADLIPVKGAEVMRLRPGTLINYSPMLSWAGGIDGQVISNVAFPKNTRVSATDCKTHKTRSSVFVESDGFFVFNRLKTGRYCLKVHDSAVPDTVETPVNITSPQNWTSGVILHALQKAHPRITKPSMHHAYKQHSPKKSYNYASPWPIPREPY